MPTVTVVERLPYSVIVKFIADCGFRPEQVKGMRMVPRCIEVDVLDDGPPRHGAGHNVTFHTMRIPYDPTEQDAPQDAKPQDRPQFPDFVVPRHPEPGSPLDAYIKACLSAGRKDIEDLRLCEPDPRYAPGGWTGPEDEKPEGMMQA